VAILPTTTYRVVPNNRLGHCSRSLETAGFGLALGRIFVKPLRIKFTDGPLKPPRALGPSPPPRRRCFLNLFNPHNQALKPEFSW
jgi:hypothetical protein